MTNVTISVWYSLSIVIPLDASTLYQHSFRIRTWELSVISSSPVRCDSTCQMRSEAGIVFFRENFASYVRVCFHSNFALLLKSVKTSKNP